MTTQGKIRILTEVKKIQMTCGLEMLWPFLDQLQRIKSSTECKTVYVNEKLCKLVENAGFW